MLDFIQLFRFFHFHFLTPSVANIRLLYEDPDASKYHRPSDDLRALENTLSNLESYLDMNPNESSLVTSMNSSCNITNCPSDGGDTLSDFDLEKFNSSSGKPINDGSKAVNLPGVVDEHQRKVWGVGRAIIQEDENDTTSLSEFHNVRDVLMNIRERLETLLKGNEKSDEENNGPNQKEKRSRNRNDGVSSDKGNMLELNISHLKHDLDRYVEKLNEKKENELRKFSENMSNQQNIVQMKKAFKRKERISKHIYETLTPATTCKPCRKAFELPCNTNNMSSANSTHVMDEFTMRRCFNETDSCCDCSEMQSVEYYSMLINEDVGEKSLHGAPHSFHNREKISLVNFRDPINVIRQWQDYQIKTIRGQKSSKARFKLRWQREVKRKPPVYGFTLDYHQTKLLQQKLDKERRIRLVCRMIFYFFSIVCFVLVVVIVQSVFNFNKRKIDVKW